MSSSAAKRARKEEHLRALVQTTDPAALARYAGELRPIVASLRGFAEDATAPRPVYSREHAREQMLKALRAVEDRIDAAAPTRHDAPTLPPSAEHGDPAGIGCAGPAL